MLVCFFNFAREAAGAAGTRHSLRPRFEAKDSCTTRTQLRRGNILSCPDLILASINLRKDFFEEDGSPGRAR
jgi:hypothetical protein